jgi:hypothetical protein
MATVVSGLTRPKAGVNHLTQTRHRTVGFVVAIIGLTLAVITLIANLVAAGQLDTNASDAAQTLAWSFGLTTFAFGTVKLGIGIILIGILIRLWLRVDSVRAGVADLYTSAGEPVATGDVKTKYGTATQGATPPPALPIHRMARTMWAPMLAMGFMALLIGLIVSVAWAADTSSVAASAWTQGLQFLGEGMLLSGISFLLGSIPAGLREGGGQVQQSLGLTVRTLKMPNTAKIFVALMMTGLMLAILQFILYLVVAGGVDTTAAWFAWLGPLRELSLGLILAGIVMALVTIGNVLGFQSDRIKEIIVSGR